MNVEMLLSAVEHRPILWDTAHVDYRSRKKNNNAWAEVANILFDDYDEQSEKIQQLFVRLVASKWRSLKHYYIKNLRKQALTTGSQGRKVRPYIYAEQFSFLNKTLGHIPIPSSVDIHETNEMMALRPQPQSLYKRKHSDLQLILDNNHSKKPLKKKVLPTYRVLKPIEKFRLQGPTMGHLQHEKESSSSPPATIQQYTPQPSSTLTAALYFANFTPDD